MSHSYNLASSEFNLLCQSQLKLLTQGLGALWSAVYLTKSEEALSFDSRVSLTKSKQASEGLSAEEFTSAVNTPPPSQGGGPWTEELVQDRETKLFPFIIYPQTESELCQKLPGIELPEIWQQVISEPINNPTFLLPDKVTEDSLSNRPQKPGNLGNKSLILPLIYENNVMGLLIVAREDRDWSEKELKQAENIAATLAIARFMERQSQWYRKQLILQQEINRWEKDRLDDLLHQLRNPLTALKTFSKLLIKKLLPEDRNQSFAMSILRESDRLSELLQQVEAEFDNVQRQNTLQPALTTPVTLSTTSVRLSETENTNQRNFLLPDSKKDLESVDLKEILEPLLLTAEVIASEKDIELVVNIEANIPPVKGNPQALREVLNNLIDNAIKYTPSRGTVKLEITVKDSLVGVAIQDTGYGIPPEVQPQIFERHYRGIQGEGDIPGSGLGLAIAKDLIQQMQGNIELISPNDLAENSNFPGTTFIVWMSIYSKNQ
ncbi:MAG: GAF domain-containing sensor histidine kinase [Xenococcaceae cyanobacterium MO_234.B1]|nr:GAF domain-containing sensor histidine kinase [Xenococcaceae cyanobacterium MO_234.B1]